ncbi:MAG: hypothetical protein ACYC0H_17985, partial [Solirubrobacteraceae bacterium]
VAGPRAVYAVVVEHGVARETLAVASYRAPAAPAPGRVQRLRVRRHGRRFIVSFGASSRTAYYRVLIQASDGRRVLRLLSRRHRSLAVPVQGYADRLSVTVSAVSPLGRRGPVSRASAG